MVVDGLLHELVPRAPPSGRGEAFTGVGVIAVEVDVRWRREPRTARHLQDWHCPGVAAVEF